MTYMSLRALLFISLTNIYLFYVTDAVAPVGSFGGDTIPYFDGASTAGDFGTGFITGGGMK
jgi:hypothetical protein